VEFGTPNFAYRRQYRCTVLLSGPHLLANHVAVRLQLQSKWSESWIKLQARRLDWKYFRLKLPCKKTWRHPKTTTNMCRWV